MRILSVLLAASAMVSAVSAQAAIVVYTDEASFLAAITAPATDGFEDLSLLNPTPAPLTRSVGSYGYTASIADDFYASGTDADRWLSTNIATETILFDSFTGGVSAIGGFFFGSSADFSYVPGATLNFSVSDGSSVLLTSLADATTNSFLGFVSTGLLGSLAVTTVQPIGAGTPTGSDFIYTAVNDLTLGVARPIVEGPGPGGGGVGAVPEPESWALLIAGFGLVGATMRRRRSIGAKSVTA